MVSTQESAFRASVAANVPVFMKGLSGIGKSSFIRNYADGARRHLESVVMMHKEKSDIAGIPSLNEADHTTEFAVPGWAKRLVDAPKGMLLLSEFNLADEDVQKAAMNLLQERQVGEDTYLPDSVVIVLDGNPPEYSAGAMDIPGPIANRMLHLDWELDREAWLTGMSDGFAAPTDRIVDDAPARPERAARERALVLSFLDAHKPFIHDQPADPARAGGPWPSPRSWDNAIRVLAHIDETQTDVRAVALRGLVGRNAADAFLRWRIDAADFDLHAVLADPTVEDWSSHHPSKTLTVLGAVSSYAVEKKTLTTWKQAVDVLLHCAEVTGRKDVCLRSARLLLSRAPQGAAIPRRAEKTFGPMLRSVGVWT